MKILIIHNHYRNYGGEDAVVQAEEEMLKKRGHKVSSYIHGNSEIDQFSLIKKINLYLNAHWSKASYLNIKGLISREKPDLAHIHNTFLLVTPSVYFACKDLGVPVVQTLHNYRFFCPGGCLYVRGGICEDCLKNRNFSKSLLYGCWRNSRILTAALVRILKFHEQKNTFKDLIRYYIALTEFSKNKFIEAGYPPDRIIVRPNFIHSVLKMAPHSGSIGSYAVFVGRLSQEKGARFLVNAWEKIKHIPLKIIGTGELLGELKSYSQRKELNIEFLGEKENTQVLEYISNAAFTVFPSECYETFGKVIIESFACGVPVIASRLGSMQELISDNRNGLLFTAGSANDFTKQVKFLWDNPKLMKQLGENAKEEYKQKYTEEESYKMLIDIYNKAIR